MPNAAIYIKGLEPLQKRIAELARFKHTLRAIDKAGQHVKRKARLYPRQSRRKQPFRTDKSRRYFFWALRSGVISVPYQRTMTLKNGWQSDAANGGFTQIISNDVSYGSLVQGMGTQASYHAGTWPTEAMIAQNEAPEVIRIIAAGIAQDVAG